MTPTPSNHPSSKWTNKIDPERRREEVQDKLNEKKLGGIESGNFPNYFALSFSPFFLTDSSRYNPIIRATMRGPIREVELPSIFSGNSPIHSFIHSSNTHLPLRFPYHIERPDPGFLTAFERPELPTYHSSYNKKKFIHPSFQLCRVRIPAMDLHHIHVHTLIRRIFTELTGILNFLLAGFF